MKSVKFVRRILVAAFLCSILGYSQAQNPSLQKSAPSDTTPASALALFTTLPKSGNPIAIKSILLGNEPVYLNTPISVSGMWLSKLRISVINTSSRAIIAGDVNIIFPETGDGTPEHPLVGAVMNLGQPPATAFRRKDGTYGPLADAAKTREAILIQPGQTMEFHSLAYPGGAQSGDAEQVAAYAAARISRARIEFRNFYFADGSKWTGYSYLEPTAPPALWRQIPADEFLSR